MNDMTARWVFRAWGYELNLNMRIFDRLLYSIMGVGCRVVGAIISGFRGVFCGYCSTPLIFTNLIDDFLD